MNVAEPFTILQRRRHQNQKVFCVYSYRNYSSDDYLFLTPQ